MIKIKNMVIVAVLLTLSGVIIGLFIYDSSRQWSTFVAETIYLWLFVLNCVLFWREKT